MLIRVKVKGSEAVSAADRSTPPPLHRMLRHLEKRWTFQRTSQRAPVHLHSRAEVAAGLAPLLPSSVLELQEESNG
jgi:hypothetical protein